MALQHCFLARPAALLAAAALAGCAGTREPAPQDLTVGDFRAPAAPAPQPATPPESTVVLDQSLGFAPQRGPTGTVEVVARPGPPAPPESADPVAAPVVVDQKVGEINTRPVWASDFLSTMADRMRRQAEQEPAGWRTWAYGQIRDELRLMLNDELIRADTLSKLRPAQRQGLSYFIEETLRRDRSERFGSEALMERELRQQNRTMGDAWQARRDQLLVDERAMQWWRQVHISADEVELEYQRRFKDFNPDPKAIFRRISVPAGNEEAIARIQRRLQDGDPFAEVAEDPANTTNAAGGGLVTEVGGFTGDYAQADFWAASAVELNQAARTLSPGAWTGPFQRGPTMNWLFLERIEQKTVSLYEAQPIIRSDLENQRWREIAEADFQRMMSRASFTDLDLMAERLVRIAERWYLEPALARRAGNQGAGGR